MDASSILTALLSDKSVSGISKATKTSSSDVTNILAAAVPSLLKGAAKQTKGSTAKGFEQALADHAGANTSNISSFIKNEDLADGAKIISHLLTASDTKKIAKASNTSLATTGAVLSAIAPLFMSLLGQQSSGSSSSAIGSLLLNLATDSNVTSLLGSLLGGSSSGSKPSGASSLVNGLMGLLK
ncbi:MAG: DUF937 domain-containing protein [Treponema sp.]|nr:DUF937 domain-containing protein [Treponema sp.]